MRLSPSIALLRTQSDQRLTALARDGHEPAFTALVERYRKPVHAACRRVLPEARAEDAAQQVFMSAWRALGRGDQVREVRPWLLRIARNTALNALRSPGYDYDELAGSLHGGEAPQAELERRDVMRQTLAGLAALPDNQREALLRTAVQGATHADIARDLGLTEGATRQLVLRARTTLRSAVSAIIPFPLVSWAAHAAARGGPDIAGGIAEAAAGGTVAGTGALLAKVGAVVVIAGGAAATPAIVHHGAQGNRAEAATRTMRQGAGPSGRQGARTAAAAATATPAAVKPAVRTGRVKRATSPAPSRRRMRSGSDDPSGPGGKKHTHSDGRSPDHSGSSDGGQGGSSGSGDGGSSHGGDDSSTGSHRDTSGSGDGGSHGGSSHGGSGDGSGDGGSGSSGSGSSGSGSSGSGSSGSGSSGSGSSGSGSSGSGSSGSGSSGSGHGGGSDDTTAPAPTPDSGDSGN